MKRLQNSLLVLLLLVVSPIFSQDIKNELVGNWRAESVDLTGIQYEEDSEEDKKLEELEFMSTRIVFHQDGSVMFIAQYDGDNFEEIYEWEINDNDKTIIFSGFRDFNQAKILSFSPKEMTLYFYEDSEAAFFIITFTKE
jgi:hypothetical protein